MKDLPTRYTTAPGDIFTIEVDRLVEQYTRYQGHTIERWLSRKITPEQVARQTADDFAQLQSDINMLCARLGLGDEAADNEVA